MVTCAEAIKEVFTNNDQILTTKQIINAIQKKYLGQWKEVTIRTLTVGCSVNHSSSKWYPSFKKFLYTVSPGRVRLYNPQKDGEFDNKIQFNPTTNIPEEEILTVEDAFELTFSLEKDLQEYLCHNLNQLEPGLTLYTGEGLTGREISTEAGKIDILARDSNDNFVLIELKASQAPNSTLSQILSYMASIKNEFNAKNVRGIIIAEDFDKKLKLAVTQVPNIVLIKYKVRFDFEKAI